VDTSSGAASLASSILLHSTASEFLVLLEEVSTFLGSVDERFGKAINNGVGEPIVLGSFLNRRGMVGHGSGSRAQIGQDVVRVLMRFGG
jgi:hypothetical protein